MALIDRQALIDSFCSQCTVDKPETCSTMLYGDKWCNEVYTILNAPTVDAVPVEDVFELAIALNKEIEALELSVRAYKALSRWECRTVGDVYALWKSGKIKKVRNLGDKSIGEIEDRLNAYLRRTEGRWR